MPSKVTKVDRDGERGYLSIERGTIVCLQVSSGRGSYVTVEQCRYKSLVIYKNFYNKQFVNGDKQKRKVKMEEKEKINTSLKQ